LRSFEAHPRIRNVKIADASHSNTALFRYARDWAAKRADMYDIAVFDETIAKSGGEFMFAASNIPQEGPVVIPGDHGRHSRGPGDGRTDRLEAVAMTNKYLGLGAKKCRRPV